LAESYSLQSKELPDEAYSCSAFYEAIKVKDFKLALVILFFLWFSIFSVGQLLLML
jgi:hypothetical protein